MASTKAPKSPTPQFFITWHIMTFGVTSKPASRDEESGLVNMHRACAESGIRAGLSMQKVCTACSNVVPTEEQVKVHIAADGKLALLTDEQINALRPEANKTMTVEAMVPMAQVPLIQLKRANYLGPVERVGNKAFELLRRAMLALDRAAVVTYTSYGRERVGIIQPSAEGLVLHECYYEDEVRAYDRLDLPEPEIKEQELALAKELVSVSEADFDVSQYTNGFRQRIAETIERQLRGEVLAPAEPVQRAEPVVDLMAALQASLAARKGPAKSKPAPSAEEAAATAVSDSQKKKAGRKKVA